MKNNAFKSKLKKMEYVPNRTDNIYCYWHTHGKMLVKFDTNNTMKIYWKADDEPKKNNIMALFQKQITKLMF